VTGGRTPQMWTVCGVFCGVFGIWDTQHTREENAEFL
jgi:hypothetical protein